MLNLYHADGVTPLNLAQETLLNVLNQDDVAGFVLKNDGLQTYSSVTAFLVADAPERVTLTLSINGRQVPVGAEGTVVPAELLDTPLAPGDILSGERHWHAPDLSNLGQGSARLVLDTAAVG